MIAEHSTAGTPSPATAPTVTVPAHLLPHLRRAAAVLAAQHAENLAANGYPNTPEDWASFNAARAHVERCLRALDDLEAGVQAPLTAVALVAEEAAQTATYRIDDGADMRQLLDTTDGLDMVAGMVALARELRALADEVGGEN